MSKIIVNDVINNSKFNSFYRNTFLICMFTAIGDGFDINVFSLIIPSLMKDWGLNPAQVGVLGSWGMFGMIFGSLFFGPLADKIGKRRALMIATLIYVVFTAGVGFVSNVTEFAVCRFIAGFGLAGAFPLVVAMASEYSPKAIRSRLTVWVTSGMASGTIVAVLVGMALIQPYGWRSMFFASGVMILLLFWQTTLPESLAYYIKKGQKDKVAETLVKCNPNFVPSPADDYQIEGAQGGKANLACLFQGGLAKNTILFWLMMVSNYIFIYGVLVWLPKLMTLQGWSLNFSLWFTLTWNLGFILGIPFFGWLQDKRGGKFALQCGLVTLAILTSILGQIKDATLLSIVLFFTGSVQHGLSGVAGSYIAQSYPLSFRGTGTSWGYGLGRVGGTLGPMIGGLLLFYKVSVPMNFIVFACLPVISAIVVSFTTDRTIEPVNVELTQLNIKG